LTQLITESGLDHCPKYVNFDPHMPRLPRIPDLLTTANLCCGVGSILLASQGQLTLACWLVFAGAFFDVLDGLAARALGGVNRWCNNWIVWRIW
jgi:phosphatidylglycerophosphate synthase